MVKTLSAVLTIKSFLDHQRSLIPYVWLSSSIACLFEHDLAPTPFAALARNQVF